MPFHIQTIHMVFHVVASLTLNYFISVYCLPFFIFRAQVSPNNFLISYALLVRRSHCVFLVAHLLSALETSVEMSTVFSECVWWYYLGRGQLPLPPSMLKSIFFNNCNVCPQVITASVHKYDGSYVSIDVIPF